MPRINKKCKAIAYSILGQPPALAAKKTAKQKKYDQCEMQSNLNSEYRYRY